MKNLFKIVALATFILFYSCAGKQEERADETKNRAKVDSLKLIKARKDSLQEAFLDTLQKVRQNQSNLNWDFINKYGKIDNPDLIALALDEKYLGEKHIKISSVNPSDADKVIGAYLILHRLWLYAQNWHYFEDDCKKCEKCEYCEEKFYLIERFLNNNRKAEVLKTVYETNKKYAFALFSKQRYENSGLKNLIKGLLYSYEEIGQNKDLLQKLYVKATKEKPNYETYKPIISKRVENILFFNDKVITTIGYGMNNNYHNVLWCYSFWVRRQAEENIDVVYAILKDFDANVDR